MRVLTIGGHGKVAPLLSPRTIGRRVRFNGGTEPIPNAIWSETP